MPETAPVIEALELLNELIHVCRTGERLYAAAAQAARAPDLRRLFETYAKQRRRFAVALQVEVVRLGGVIEAPEQADAGQVLQHANTARLGDEHTALAALAQTEDQTVRAYEQANALALSTPLRAVVERQQTALIGARQQIHSLRRPPKKSA